MFRSSTAPITNTHQSTSTSINNSAVTPTTGFLHQLYQTILTHPVTVVSGEPGCGKTSAICYLKENEFSPSSSSKTGTSSSSSSFESILHLCGTTLDSVNPKKIARRLIVELCRLLQANNEQQQQDEQDQTTISSSEIETLLSAANTAPDEHLAEITLQSLETYMNIQSKKGGGSGLSSKNLVIFIDAVDTMFFALSSSSSSKRNINKNTVQQSSSSSLSTVADSPIMQLFDLLPIQAGNLFPRIRFVFTLRRDPTAASSPSSSSETVIIQKVLNRLSGGADCFTLSSSSSASSSSSSKSHHTCLATFPLSLTKSSAQKIITSQLQVFGKHWSKEMMQEAISTLPDSTEAVTSSSSVSSSSLAYTFFASRDAERIRHERKRLQQQMQQQQQQIQQQQQQQMQQQTLQEDTGNDDTFENDEILFSHFYSSSQKIPLPPKSQLEASMIKAFFSSPSSSSESSSSSSSLFNAKCGSPRYISVLIKELVATATFETLEESFAKILTQCETTQDLLQFVIERVGNQFGLDEVLGVIACLLETEIGLSEREIFLITGVPLRTVVAVLGNSGIRDFFVDRAGVLKGSAELEEAFISVCSRNSKNANRIKAMVRCGAVQMFLQLLNDQPRESLGRVCRELPQLLLAINRPRCLARFLARQDVMAEMFVASKKDEFLSLWKEVLNFRESSSSSSSSSSSIEIDDPLWLFPVFEGSSSFSQRTLYDESEEAKSPMLFFPNSEFGPSLSSTSNRTSSKSSRRNSTTMGRSASSSITTTSASLADATSSASASVTAAPPMSLSTSMITSSATAVSLTTSILQSNHADFYHVETLHPLHDNHRIEVIILLARLWGSFNKNDTAIKMLQRAVEAVKKNEKSNGAGAHADENDKKIIQSTKAQLLQRLAQAQVREGKFQQAVNVVKQALTVALPQQVPGLLKVLGRGFRKLGDYHQALDCFDQALKSIKASSSSSSSSSLFSSSSMNKTKNKNQKDSSASLLLEQEKALKTESTSKYFQKMDFDIASCLDEKADALRKLDRNAEALSILKEALAMKQATLPSRHPAIADTLYSIAAAEKANGNPLKAFNLVSEGITIIQNFYGPESKRLFDLKFLQASCSVVLDHLPLALILFQELLEFSLLRFGEGKLETAETMQQLAQTYKKMSRYRQASDLLPKAFDALKKILITEQQKSGHPKLVKILIQLADLDRKVGKHADALRHAEEAVAMSKALFEAEKEKKKNKKGADENENEHEPNDRNDNSNNNNKKHLDDLYDVQTAEAFISLASAKLKQSSTDEELEKIAKACQTSLAICEARLGEDHITTASCLIVFGDTQRKMTNQLLSALEKYQRALKIYEDSFGPRHVEVTDTLYKIGRCQKKMHWYSRAQRTYELAIERMIENAEQKKLGGNSSTSSNNNTNQQQQQQQNLSSLNALFASKQKQFPQQTKGFGGSSRRAAFQEQHRTPDDDDIMKTPKMALLQQSLGDTFRKQLEVDKARRLYEQALETNHFHFGQKHEEVAECLNGLAMCLFLDERFEEAFELETKVVNMTMELLGPENRHTKNRQRNLNMIMDKVSSPLEV